MANVFRFTLGGLIMFSLALLGGAASLTYRLMSPPPAGWFTSANASRADPSVSTHIGPWGTMITRDIKLERPTEYLAAEVTRPERPETWVFAGMRPEDVRALFATRGLTAEQIEAAFAPGHVALSDAGVELTPSRAFLLSLDPAARRTLYTALAGHGINPYLDTPFVFAAEAMPGITADARVHPEDAELLRQLVYPDGGTYRLADYDALLWHTPTAERRIALTRVLSQQPVVFARLQIAADTNIDEMAGYWGQMPHVRFTDIRPMFEALQASPAGGSLNLLFLLPPFARERLYTFPLPPMPGDPLMDCHWSTFNFSNAEPDNRFNDPEYVVQFIKDNYYQVTTPTVYGDIVLLVNDQQDIKHSAVYIAADLVFTKNGSNYRAPWVLMRIADMQRVYASEGRLHVTYFRRRVD